MIDQPSTIHSSTDVLRLVAPYLSSKELTRASFVCRSWSRALLPRLWWNGIQNIWPLFERFCYRIADHASKNRPGCQLQELLSDGLSQETEDFIRVISQFLQRELDKDLDALQGCTDFKSNSCMALDILTESGWGKNIKQLQFVPGNGHSRRFYTDFQPDRDRWQLQGILTTLASLVGSAAVKDLTLNIGMYDVREPREALLWRPSNQANTASTLTSFMLQSSPIQAKFLEEALEGNPNLTSLKFFYPWSPWYDTDPTVPDQYRPGFHKSLKSLHVEGGTILQSTFWFLLGCTKALQSVHLLHSRITDSPTQIPVQQTFQTITSLVLEGFCCRRPILRALLASCPGLEELEMNYEMYSSEEDQGSIFPTVAATIDVTSTTASEQQLFPNLRTVAFKFLNDSLPFIVEQFEFMRQLPALESARVSLSGRYTFHPEVTDTHDLTNSDGFRKVKSFELDLHSLTPYIMSRIFQLVPKCTSVRIREFKATDHAGPLSRLHPTQGERWRRGTFSNDQALLEGEIFRKYSQSLERLYFGGQEPLSASALLPVLRFCRKLKHLDGTGAMTLKCTLENLKTPWVCEELETLKIFMDCGGTDEAKDQDDSELSGIDRVTENFVLTQKALFTRLAQLSNLRTLAICQGGNNPGIDLSLKTGLDLLAPLERLEELDVRHSTSEEPLWLDDEVVYRICDNMDVEDATWIAENWCMLKVVRGITWFVPEGVQALQQLLTTRHGVKFIDK